MPAKRNNRLHVKSHRVLLPRKQVPLANPVAYPCLKLWSCCCSNALSHGGRGHLFSAASFLPKWDGLGHTACPVILSPVPWDTPSSPHFLAQPAPKLWHPSVDLQFWEKLNHGFTTG